MNRDSAGHLVDSISHGSLNLGVLEDGDQSVRVRGSREISAGRHVLGLDERASRPISSSIKTVSSGGETGRNARANVVHGGAVRKSGTDGRSEQVYPGRYLLALGANSWGGGWRKGVDMLRVNTDLTRGTNKFDGTPIRNSPRLSDDQDLIRRNVARSIDCDAKCVKDAKTVSCINTLYSEEFICART